METRKNGMEGKNETWFGARKARETNDRKGINAQKASPDRTQTLGRYARDCPLTYTSVGQETTLTTTFPPHARLFAPSANT